MNCHSISTDSTPENDLWLVIHFRHVWAISLPLKVRSNDHVSPPTGLGVEVVTFQWARL